MPVFYKLENVRFRFFGIASSWTTTTSTAMADNTEPMNADGDAAMVDEGPVVDVPASGASMEEEKEEDTCR
jgi:hypothetical protein